MSTGDHTPRDAPAPAGGVPTLHDLARLGLACLQAQALAQQNKDVRYHREARAAERRLREACEAVLAPGQPGGAGT